MLLAIFSLAAGVLLVTYYDGELARRIYHWQMRLLNAPPRADAARWMLAQGVVLIVLGVLGFYAALVLLRGT